PEPPSSCSSSSTTAPPERRSQNVTRRYREEFTHLVITGSHFAKSEAERGALPAEVWLALGRAANELHDISLDLDEHQDLLQYLGTRPATSAAKPPAPAPLVVRRRR
ncbi:hypothetical protein ACPCAJ_27170, partial [Streptomyces griseoincarnatus]